MVDCKNMFTRLLDINDKAKYQVYLNTWRAQKCIHSSNFVFMLLDGAAIFRETTEFRLN